MKHQSRIRDRIAAIEHHWLILKILFAHCPDVAAYMLSLIVDTLAIQYSVSLESQVGSKKMACCRRNVEPRAQKYNNGKGGSMPHVLTFLTPHRRFLRLRMHTKKPMRIPRASAPGIRSTLHSC